MITKKDFKVLAIVENPDGSATVNLDISDDFKAWFKETQGLKRFSQRRFEQWFVDALKSHLKRAHI